MIFFFDLGTITSNYGEKLFEVIARFIIPGPLIGVEMQNLAFDEGWIFRWITVWWVRSYKASWF